MIGCWFESEIFKYYFVYTLYYDGYNFIKNGRGDNTRD